MKLLFSAGSPFVRKVRVTAALCGLEARIEPVPVDAWASPGALVGANPLSRVPCLITDDGVALFDSPVICEYLDHLGEGGLFPPPSPKRWRALRQQALGDGLMDAAVLRRREEMRPDDAAHRGAVERQTGVMRRALDAMEAETLTGHMDIGAVTFGCALGYLDFRFGHEDWRAGRPKLAEWAARLMATPEFTATQPPPA